MPFPWLALAVSIGFTLLGQLLAPKPKTKATTFEEFQVPTATEDRPKPYWVGTVRHRSPNCIWWGDYSTKAIKKGGSILTLGQSVVTGYKYFLGFQMNLGWGELDELLKITMNDKEAWSGSISSGTISINKPTLFGGENEGSSNGGFQGYAVVYNGDGTQSADPYVVAKSGATPAYKTDVLVVFKGFSGGGAYVGNSANLPELSFDARRCPNQLGVTGGKHVIDTYDANPVCALFEFMTRPNNEFGAGFSAAQFNLTNWRAAAETLHAEGLGMSRMFDSSQDVETVINEFLNLIDGVINVNMATGKMEIALARDDYDPDTLPAIDEDDVLEVVSFKRGSWSETYNEVRLSYIDRTQEFESIPVAAQDAANAASLAEVRSQTVQFHGISNPTVANKITFRELRVLSTPLASITLRVNRVGFDLKGGAVFKWVGTRHGVAGMIFRVTEVNTGRIENGVIEVKAVQDVFALSSTAFAPPSPTTWSPPSTTPSAITVQDIYEQPYFFHKTENRRAMTVAKPVNGAQLSYALHTKESTATEYSERISEVIYTPTGTLFQDYTSTPFNTTSDLIVIPDYGMDDLPDTVAPAEIESGSSGLLIINDEILAYESYTINGSGHYVFNNVWGGLLDTVLAEHTTADRVWFISEGIALDATNYSDGATVNAKLQSKSPTGSVDLGSCTAINL